MWLLVPVFVCGVAQATLTGHPNSGTCLCVTGTGVSAHNHAGLSGHVVASVSHPQCYPFHGGVASKDGYKWYQLSHVHGHVAWVAGNYLSKSTHSKCTHHHTSGGTCSDATAKDYACKLMHLHTTGHITLAKVHPSSVHDDAFVYNNIRDACAGHAAARSQYACKPYMMTPYRDPGQDRGRQRYSTYSTQSYTCSICQSPGAPGGHVCLSRSLLHYVYTIATTVPHLHVNELAGACHTCHSHHYDGGAVDLHNGAGSSTMLQKCFSMGGWGQDEGNHIHCQF